MIKAIYCKFITIGHENNDSLQLIEIMYHSFKEEVSVRFKVVWQEVTVLNHGNILFSVMHVKVFVEDCIQ